MGRACAKSCDGARGSNWTSDQWFSFQWKFHVRVENQYDDFVKAMQDSMAFFIYLGFIFILYDNGSLDRAAKDYGRLSPIFAWQLCISS